MSPIRAVLSGAVIAIIVAGCVDRESPTSPRRPRIAAVLWPNEPTDAALVTDQPWESATFDGWHLEENDSGYVSIAQDASAPFSPSGVLQARLPAGFTGGELAYPNRDINPTPRVYVGLWWKPSNPWSGPGMPIQYLLTSVDGLISMSMVDSAESGRYKLKVHPGFTTSPDNQLLEQNVNPNVSITLGQWHRVEWLVDYSTASGRVEWWLDGVLLGNYNNDAAPPGGLQFIQYNHYMEWHGSAKPETDYFWFDHTRVATFTAGSVPTLPPDSIPAGLYDDANLVLNSTRLHAPFVRDVVALLFAQGTPQPDRQAAINQVSGQVIGGSQYPDGDGYYLVKVPGDGTDSPVFDAIAQLEALPQVSVATVEMLVENPLGYLRPNDGQGRQRADWSTSPNNASGANWSLEAVAAPMAWGCDTGSTSTPIGVVDNEFASQVPDLQPNVQEMFRADAFPQLLSHGVFVASALGAVGNNNTGGTGMMWRAGLRLYEYGAFTAQGTPIVRHGEAVLTGRALANRVVRAAVQGARVVNLSMFWQWPLGPPRVKADSDDISHFIRPLIHDLRTRMPSQGPPLLVVIAGNNGQFPPTRQLNAFWSGLPALADTFPNTVLVVGASDSTRTYASFADTGHLVSVAAPGVDVTVLRRDGSDTVVSGTSVAAPLVSGLAGLLLSFDPSITTSDLRRYIVEGARAGGKTAGGVPIINAYESLKLAAAKRPGAPLCGNRVWITGTQLVAQRDTNAAPQVLANLGEPAAFVNVHHGGRRVDVWNNDFVQRSFVFDQGAWTESTNPPASPDGGAWNSLWSLSHDGDSAVTVQVTGANGSSFEVRRGPTGGASTHLADITVPLSSSQAYTCLWVSNDTGVCGDSVFTGYGESASSKAAAYSPLGDRVIVAITKRSHQSTNVSGYSPCPWGPAEAQCRTIDYLDQTIGTTFYQVDLHNGTQSALATAQVEVWWGALAEDGGQLVTGESTWSETSTLHPTTNGSFKYVRDAAPPVIGACTLRYRQASSGMPSRFATASDDVCRGPLGGGSTAPSPPVSGRSQ